MSPLRTRRSPHIGRTAVLACFVAATLAVTGCVSTGGETSAEQGTLTVVTSTSVWGSVARAVGGDSVEVEPIIDNAEADPHSYESTPRDAVRIDNADLVVFNGGGFDPFVRQILSANAGDQPVVEAFRVAGEHGQHHGASPTTGEHHRHEHGNEQPGHGHGHGQPGHEHGHGQHSPGNEHVWYDLRTVGAVADRIADELARIQPDGQRAFRDSAAEFNAELRRLDERVMRIAEQHRGEKVIATAPVADPLIERAGLDDITPPSFVQAVESSSDPAAASIARIQNLVDSQQASVVIHNPQTASPLTERLRARAQQTGTPVVTMTGLLPPDRTYSEWMRAQIAGLETALNTEH